MDANTSIDEAEQIANDSWEHGEDYEEIVETLTLNGYYRPNGQVWTVDTVERLIADPKRRRFASEGFSVPLEIASPNKKKNKKKRDRSRQLRKYVREGNVSGVRDLLAKGVKPSARMMRIKVPILLESSLESKEIATMLMDAARQ